MVYKVEYLEGGIVDITTHVVTCDKWKKYSDGRISQAAFTLDTQFGAFITDTNGGTTPIIDEFDRFRITWFDEDGVTEESHIFELKTDMSQFDKQSDYLLPLELEGRERNLAFIPFSGYYDIGFTHFEMANIILNTFEKNDGTVQPIFTAADGGTPQNLLPDNNPNIWDFQYIDNCLDALKEIVKHANLPVSAGGAGDRFAIIFDDDTVSPLTTVVVRIISQGTRNSPTFPTLESTLTVPIQKIEKIKENKTATRVIARGKPGSSTMPSNFGKYRSREEFFIRIQQYDDAKTYLIGNHVRHDNIVYIAILAVPISTLPPNATFWSVVTFGDFVGDIQYSPYTQNKQALFRNGWGNPEGALDPDVFTSLAVPDCNQIILDAATFRDWVHIRSITDNWSADADLKKYLFNGVFSGLIDGFKVLVDTQLGTPIGAFAGALDAFGTGAGNDPNGFPYADAMATYNKKFDAWFVFRQQSSGSITAFANAGGGKTIVTVSVAHKLSSGRKVRINGTSNYNGTHKIESVTATTFVIPVAFVSTETGTWVTGDSDECSVWRERKIYEWNVAFSSGSRVPAQDDRERGGPKTGVRKWRDASGEFLGNDCWHAPTFVANAEGLIDPQFNPAQSENYTKDSAIRIKYGYTTTADTPEYKSILDGILGFMNLQGALGTIVLNMIANLFTLFATPYYTSAGWWVSWSSPYPLSTHNAIIEKVGELYGGDANSIQDHHFFDMYNQRFTKTGKEGWNQPDGDDLMEITGFTFLYQLFINAGGSLIPFTGDIPVSYWVIDNNGTIWKSKDTYRHLGDVQRFTFYFGNFTPVYRARSPLGISNIVENLLTPELELRDIFFKNFVVWQGFQLEMSYDEQGRYMPNLMETVLKPSIFNMFSFPATGVTLEFDGTFDAWSWVKTPVALSAADAESAARAIFTNIKDYPQVTNIEQLQRIADAQLDIEEFRYEQYAVENFKKVDRKLQDTLFLKDQFLIKESDGGANTREVVVSEIHYEELKNTSMKRTLIVKVRIPKQ